MDVKRKRLDCYVTYRDQHWATTYLLSSDFTRVTFIGSKEDSADFGFGSSLGERFGKAEWILRSFFGVGGIWPLETKSRRLSAENGK